MHGTDVGEHFLFRELNFVASVEMRSMSDASGMASRIATVFFESGVFNGWEKKMPWVEETLITLFLLWPIGVEKKFVIKGIEALPDKAFESKKTQVAIFMIKKLIQGVDDLQPGARMDIASLRMTYPRLSWYANKLAIHMDEKFNWKTAWWSQSESTPFAPLILNILCEQDFNHLMMSWRMANRAAMISDVNTDSNFNKMMMVFANKVYLGEEAKWMSKRMKRITPTNHLDTGLSLETEEEMNMEVNSHSPYEDNFLVNAVSIVEGVENPSMAQYAGAHVTATVPFRNRRMEELTLAEMYGGPMDC
jgi:hypothetical protein